MNVCVHVSGDLIFCHRFLIKYKFFILLGLAPLENVKIKVCISVETYFYVEKFLDRIPSGDVCVNLISYSNKKEKRNFLLLVYFDAGLEGRNCAFF